MRLSRPFKAAPAARSRPHRRWRCGSRATAGQGRSPRRYPVSLSPVIAAVGRVPRHPCRSGMVLAEEKLSRRTDRSIITGSADTGRSAWSTGSGRDASYNDGPERYRAPSDISVSGRHRRLGCTGPKFRCRHVPTLDDETLLDTFSACRPPQVRHIPIRGNQVDRVGLRLRGEGLEGACLGGAGEWDDAGWSFP